MRPPSAAGQDRSRSSTSSGKTPSWSRAGRSPRACSALAGRSARTPCTSCRRPRRSARWASRSATSCLRSHGLHSAQVLLTNADMADRQRYLNARSTLRTLLGLNVIPVINENDTVVTDEIKLGDNDTLAALVTNLIEADALIILTDQAGLFDADPRKNQHARIVEQARRDGSPAGKPGRRRGSARQGRHADQDAGRAARSAQRRAHRDRLGEPDVLSGSRAASASAPSHCADRAPRGAQAVARRPPRGERPGAPRCRRRQSADARRQERCCRSA